MNQNKAIVEDNNMLIVDLGFSSVKFLRADEKGTVTSCFRKVKGGEGYRFGGDNYLIGENGISLPSDR